MTDRLVLLAPIPPAASGNGLAMRAELFRSAFARRFDVTTIVVPVAGALPPGVQAQQHIAVDLDPVAARAGTVGLMAEPRWRERLAAAAPFPGPAAAASLGLVERVLAAAPRDAVALHVMRSYIAPLGMALAERLTLDRLTLDLDDDDFGYAMRAGDSTGAAAYGRLLDTFVGGFHAISAAAPAEAAAIAARHGLAVVTIPNAIAMPPAAVRDQARRDTHDPLLLFVGNLTYPPNVLAARRLVTDVLPRVRERLGRPVTASLVGHCGPDVDCLRREGVEVRGFVPDLDQVYAAATVVVVPLEYAAGTRIKLLEAFAHRVPVVASGAAAEGLAVQAGRHLLIAETADAIAAAVATVISDLTMAERLTKAAAELVERHYSIDAVASRIEHFLDGTADAIVRDESVSPNGARYGPAPE